MSPRRILPVFAALALVACSGDAVEPQGATASTTDPPRAGSRAREQPRDLPEVRMQAGTDSATGALVEVCRGKRCEERAATAARSLEHAENGLLLFLVGSAPSAAAVAIRRASGGRVVASGSLRPNEVMPFVADLAGGRYIVTLDATWKRVRGRWVFGLRVRRS